MYRKPYCPQLLFQKSAIANIYKDLIEVTGFQWHMRDSIRCRTLNVDMGLNFILLQNGGSIIYIIAKDA